MSSRAISLIVAIPVLFLFYGFDINNKIRQSDERISQLWTTIEKHYQQRNKQLSIVLQEWEDMKSPLLKSQDVLIDIIAARKRLLVIPTKPDMFHQQAVFESFIQAQNQLDVVLKALLVEIRQSSLKKQEQLLSAIVQLEQYQQMIKELYIDYAREVDDYNLMVSRFPGSVFAEMKGYQLKSTLNMHYKAGRVDFNNLVIPDSK
ncbi:MAG TPA: hypothetical protein ENJ33_00110 [Thiothrix sp.]|nr:hypothetical protein [Thiothrix sp.]